MPLILSDLHLGLSPLEVGHLAPLIEAADELWLNGDTAEVRHPRYRDRAVRLLDELHAACARRGLPLVQLAGNHDHDESFPLYRMLAGDRVLVTHGHAFIPEIAPWSVWAREAGRRHRAYLHGLPEQERGSMQAALCAAVAASEAAWSDTSRERKLHAAAMLTRPWAIVAVVRTWMAWSRRVHDFVRTHQPQARVVVSGHSHRRSCVRVADRWHLNTGGFNPPARPAAVWVRDNDVAWIPLSRRGGRYELPPESRWRRVSV
jgi:UDP-2,3-diacylglucosamine pyrophosphatase LpxH